MDAKKARKLSKATEEWQIRKDAERAAKEKKMKAARAVGEKARAEDVLWPKAQKEIEKVASGLGSQHHVIGTTSIHLDCGSPTAASRLGQLAERAGFRVKHTHSEEREDLCDGYYSPEAWGVTISW